MQIREKITQILQYLSEDIYEKEEVIRLAFLATIAEESIFLLGPPGVAKSLIARRLKYAFKDGKSFEYLMNRFSTPDEIFGPVSIKRLKDEDKYERQTEKYLPGANIVFLDEIWKAGPAIQNALLTILNEKIYRNGEQELAVQIRGIISASNEIPLASDGVEALWDRFLLRYYLDNIRNSQNFIDMITSTKDVYEDNLPPNLKVSKEELEEWLEKIKIVIIPAEVTNTIQLIRLKIEEYNEKQEENSIRIYDRRWKKIIQLLRTAAFLNGREQVDLMDCFLIVHCLWEKPQHFNPVMEMVQDVIRKHGYSVALNLQTIKKELQEFEEEVALETKIKNQVWKDEPLTVNKDFFEVLNAQLYFDGFMVKKAEFAKLSTDETNSISLYDADKNLTNRVQAQLSEQANAILINHNSKLTPFNLKTKKTESTEVIYKKPHPIIFKYWEERTETLTSYLEQQQQKLETEYPSEMNHLKENFFVHPKLSEIVTENITQVQKTLNSLKLRVEKNAFYYKNLS